MHAIINGTEVTAMVTGFQQQTCIWQHGMFTTITETILTWNGKCQPSAQSLILVLYRCLYFQAAGRHKIHQHIVPRTLPSR